MSTTTLPALLLACTLAGPVCAQPAGERLGDHPAIVVQRLRLQQGYDYAAQFYPHPAWLYLVAAAPRPAAPPPASVIAGAPRPHPGDAHERSH